MTTYNITFFPISKDPKKNKKKTRKKQKKDGIPRRRLYILYYQ